jgi:hypothetical protein
VTADKACSFCAAPRNEVRVLVESPRALICDACVATGADAVDTDEGVDCVFCQAARASYIAGAAAICPECLALSRQIIVEASPNGLPAARVVKRQR